MQTQTTRTRRQPSKPVGPSKRAILALTTELVEEHEALEAQAQALLARGLFDTPRAAVMQARLRRREWTVKALGEAIHAGTFSQGTMARAAKMEAHLADLQRVAAQTYTTGRASVGAALLGIEPGLWTLYQKAGTQEAGLMAARLEALLAPTRRQPTSEPQETGLSA